MLTRVMRLRKAGEFRSVFGGRSALRGASSTVKRVVSSELLTLHVGRRRIVTAGGSGAIADLPGLRFGFTISKKTAKRAHDRNRIKRRLSEAARIDIAPVYKLPERYDCVVVARSGAVAADYKLLRGELIKLCIAAGLIDGHNWETLDA